MTGLFQNGKKRITTLVIWKLAWGTGVMVLNQIQGFIPQLDFLSPKSIKVISFIFAVVLSSSKGVEMFFDQTLQLFQGHDDEPDAAAAVSGQLPVVQPTIVPPAAPPPGHIP